MIHGPERHVLLFRRPLPNKSGVSGGKNAAQPQVSRFPIVACRLLLSRRRCILEFPGWSSLMSSSREAVVLKCEVITVRLLYHFYLFSYPSLASRYPASRPSFTVLFSVQLIALCLYLRCVFAAINFMSFCFCRQHASSIEERRTRSGVMALGCAESLVF